VGAPRRGEEGENADYPLKIKANQSKVKNSIRIPTGTREIYFWDKEEPFKQPSPEFGFNLGGGTIKVRNKNGRKTETTFGSKNLVELIVVYSFSSMPCMEINRKYNN
jgi:hypothetical protein